MEAQLIRGELPAWAAISGYGYGSGYGDGDGYGYGYGYGYGDGNGYGYGYGDGSDIVTCRPVPQLVTVDTLTNAEACASEVRRFKRLFPDGGTWPDDIVKARDAGLPIDWCREKLGLLEPR